MLCELMRGKSPNRTNELCGRTILGSPTQSHKLGSKGGKQSCRLYYKLFVFVEAEAGAFFNQNFINFKMDMEKHKDGPRLARKYRLTAYPTLYFVNANEDIAKYSVGYLTLQKLLNFGKSAVQ